MLQKFPGCASHRAPKVPRLCLTQCAISSSVVSHSTNPNSLVLPPMTHQKFPGCTTLNEPKFPGSDSNNEPKFS